MTLPSPNPVPIPRTGSPHFHPPKSRPNRRTGVSRTGLESAISHSYRYLTPTSIPSGRTSDGLDAVPLTNPVRPSLSIGRDGVGDWTG